MFTPPPSPPLPKQRPSPPPPHPTAANIPPPPPLPSPDVAKRSVARRTRWAVLLVPLVIVLITASTRYLVHPVALDLFPQPPVWQSSLTNWTPHKRHPAPDPQNSPTSASPTPTTSATSTSRPSSTVSSNGPLPTIPSSPPTLPTPFPQPFDADLTQNFSSVSCFNFFSNMTNSVPFRSCRSFAMLLQSSAAFINAQQNYTLLNSIIWGTCNTNTPEDQCVSNMGWFESTLKTACVKDLSDGNTMAVESLTALQAYKLMRDVACLPDPTANTYCYLNAARNANPSDLYFYQLGIGVNLPETTTPSCSACTQSVMRSYAEAINDPAQADDLVGLKKTYKAAAALANKQCGTAYATLASNGGTPLFRRAGTGIVGAAVLLCWALLLGLP